MKKIGKLFFSLKIKEKRLERKLTEEQLAKLANVSQSYISYLERKNRKKSPTLKSIGRIAEALECCPLSLIECHCSICETKNKKNI